MSERKNANRKERKNKGKKQQRLLFLTRHRSKDVDRYPAGLHVRNIPSTATASQQGQENGQCIGGSRARLGPGSAILHHHHNHWEIRKMEIMEIKEREKGRGGEGRGEMKRKTGGRNRRKEMMGLGKREKGGRRGREGEREREE